VVVRYNPDTFTVGNKRITCKELPRKDKEGIFLSELKKVMLQAAHPESFPPFLRVIKIGFDCNCVSTTECGFIQTTDYPRPRVITHSLYSHAILDVGVGCTQHAQSKNKTHLQPQPATKKSSASASVKLLDIRRTKEMLAYVS